MKIKLKRHIDFFNNRYEKGFVMEAEKRTINLYKIFTFDKNFFFFLHPKDFYILSSYDCIKLDSINNPD